MRHILQGQIRCACTACDRKGEEEETPKSKSNVEKEKKVDEISNKEEEEKKNRAALMGLSAEELDDELDKLRTELESLKKGSKSANLEKIGVDNSYIKTKRHVLRLHNNRDTQDDELLKSMGSK